ncbi:hypothetical protein KLP28_00345 [Nocardioidaceae bacterium]|nr:hypothetical protein KLP28_00345 [Nocardioidaceae bacterium]
MPTPDRRVVLGSVFVTVAGTAAAVMLVGTVGSTGDSPGVGDRGASSAPRSAGVLVAKATTNNADPGCKGVQNPSCQGRMDVLFTDPAAGRLLYPGVRVPLAARVANPNGFPIEVVSATTDRLGASTCGTAPVLTPNAGKLSIVVPARTPAASAARVPAGSITLPASASSACENARFSLRVTVTAVKP